MKWKKQRLISEWLLSPLPAVLGLHLASLPRGGFVCSDYLHLTALRSESTAAVSLADTNIPSLGHTHIYTTHKQWLHMFNICLQLRVRSFYSKMSNTDVYEMESSCVHGGLDSSRAPSTVHWCTSTPADPSEGQGPVCLHQLRCSAPVQEHVWGEALWGHMGGAPQLLCVAWKHKQLCLHGASMETSMSDRFEVRPVEESEA